MVAKLEKFVLYRFKVESYRRKVFFLNSLTLSRLRQKKIIVTRSPFKYKIGKEQFSVHKLFKVIDLKIAAHCLISPHFAETVLVNYFSASLSYKLKCLRIESLTLNGS